MKECKKCGTEFIPRKGLINYCSMKCRQGKQWTEEDKQKKSDANIKILSIDEINDIKRVFSIFGTISSTAKALNLDSRLIKKYVNFVRTAGKSPAYHVGTWLKRTKDYLVDYKGGKCICCGYNKCNQALQFHHLDPNEKDFSIGGKTASIERLKKEVDKCVLVCGNCHVEIHSKIINIKDYL